MPSCLRRAPRAPSTLVALVLLLAPAGVVSAQGREDPLGVRPLSPDQSGPDKAGKAAGSRLAYSLLLNSEIGPPTERALKRALDRARKRRAAMVIIRLDTPGGLAESTRKMVKDILASRVPVIVYVHPNGARASSAGVFLAMAADVAAMAPQTNIGSATPIAIGPSGPTELRGAVGRKAVNSAASMVRALAQGHDRNADLAERMVRRATNVTASKARREGLIDLLVPNERLLLQRLDGFRLRGRKEKVLETDGLRIDRADISAGALKGGAEAPDSTGGSFFFGPFALAGFGLLGASILLWLWGRAPRWSRR